MRSIGRGAVVTALIAAAALCGPLVQAALADDITFVTTPDRRLVLTGTGADSQVTVGPGTLTNMDYRFTSNANITVAANARAFCGSPAPALAVECDDDPTPMKSGDDIESIRVDGGVGDDRITASGPLPSLPPAAASLLLDGGAGADILTGGVRAETLSGGAGNDGINGGPGADVLNGDSGSDEIEARDGVMDSVRCGTDLDSAFADSFDTFPDNDCESPAPAPPPPPPPLPGSGSKPAGPPIAIGVSAAFENSRRGTRVRRLTVRYMPAGIVVRVTCRSPSKLRGGARCPFKLVRVPVNRKRARLALSTRFRGRRLAPSTVIRIFGVAAGRLGTLVRFKLRTGRAPYRSDGCANSALKSISCLSVDPG